MSLHLPFGARLLLALTVTLCVSGALVVIVNAPHVKQALVHAALERHQGDAEIVEDAWIHPKPDQTPMSEVAQVVDRLQLRPGSVEVLLIDPRGVVVAASRRDAVGRRLAGADVRATLRGFPRAGTVGSGDAEHFSLWSPVRLGTERYALHSELASSELRAAGTNARRHSAMSVLLGLIVAVPTFYLIGGRALSQSHRAAVDRAARDPLTSLGNFATFASELDRAVRHADRDEEPVSLAIVDVDHFKELNDNRGHRFGDQALRTVATVLDRTRPGDRAFRTGGDEFAVLLPGTSEADAVRVLVRLQEHARSAGHAFTMSIGVATRVSADVDAGELRELADAAMYRAKRRGGNTVVGASERGSSASMEVLAPA